MVKVAFVPKGGGGEGGLRIGLTRQLESCQPGNQTM